MESEEEVPSIMDDDEWTDRNFGNSFDQENLEKGRKAAKKQNLEEDEDTSEDSVSDLETDTDDEDDDGPDSRPLTANEARQLRKEWLKKNYLGDSDKER